MVSTYTVTMLAVQDEIRPRDQTQLRVVHGSLAQRPTRLRRVLQVGQTIFHLTASTL